MITKIHDISPEFRHFGLCWVSEWLGRVSISHKTTCDIPNIENSDTKLNKMFGFSKPPFTFHLFFETIRHINSETNPPLTIINVVCKFSEIFPGNELVLIIYVRYCHKIWGSQANKMGSQFFFQKFFKSIWFTYDMPKDCDTKILLLHQLRRMGVVS